jgi:hypothetical protein
VKFFQHRRRTFLPQQAQIFTHHATFPRRLLHRIELAM